MTTPSAAPPAAAFQGNDRLLFGMDICEPPAPDAPNRLADFLKDLRGRGAISETVFHKVARENAARLLGL